MIHRPCCLVGVGSAAASRRSTGGVLPPRDRARRVRTGGLSSPVIRAAFAALHPDRTGLLAKAALHSKGGREPGATRTCCVRNHSGAGATPAPSLRRLVMTPTLSRRADHRPGTADVKFNPPI